MTPDRAPSNLGSPDGVRTLDPWMCRALGFGLALVTAKTIMVAVDGSVDLLDLRVLPALLHDHLLIMLLYGGLDLFARLRGTRRDQEEEAGRLMWLVMGLLLLWAAASVPIASALGAPQSLAALRAAGGVMAVVHDGLSWTSALGALVVVAVGLGSAMGLARAPRRRVVPVAVVLMVTIAVFGPMGRDQVDLAGLDRDPFAVIIQGIWEGLQALGAG